MNPSILPPSGDLCAGVPYRYVALDSQSCLTIEWVLVSYPVAANPADVIISAPFSLITDITVPVSGEYSFALRCCVEA